MFEVALFMIFPLTLAFAAIYDLFTLTIPNRLSIIMIAGFLIMFPFVGLSGMDIAYHAMVASIVLAVGFGLFVLGYVGGGDVKIAASTALWLGPAFILHYLVWAALFGGLLSLVILAVRRMPLPASAYDIEWVSRLTDNKNGVPYGVALSSAAIFVYPQTVWFQILQ